jgi:hypothetical protein
VCINLNQSCYSLNGGEFFTMNNEILNVRKSTRCENLNGLFVDLIGQQPTSRYSDFALL